VQELAAGVRRIDAIDRSYCRRVAVERYSVTAMADGYERVYREL
jgi:hypothetical protein